ncbi:hypothetical protein NKG94_29345 [Micromonospora sp. M12]
MPRKDEPAQQKRLHPGAGGADRRPAHRRGPGQAQAAAASTATPLPLKTVADVVSAGDRVSSAVAAPRPTSW